MSFTPLYVRARPHIPELLQTILDIGWTGMDVAQHTHYNRPSEFVDLVAGGNRECLGDQPDLFYSAAFIDITPGREYTMHLAPSDAVCIHAVMSSHKGGVTTQTSWATRSPEEAHREQVVRICNSPGDPTVLDTSPHTGLCITFVRQYFLDPVDGSKYAQHAPRLEMTKRGDVSRRLLPASVPAALNFLPLRELTILIKFLSFFIGRKRSPNKWVLTDVDKLKGAATRLKETLVNERGRYLFLDLSLRQRETLEVLYRPKKNTWFSAAFVSRATRTLDYINLCRTLPGADGLIHLNVSQNDRDPRASLSTRGRRTGTLLIREVSTDGRILREDRELPDAIVHP